MNWTGGRLQQSRRSGSAANAKQRAHFARARAKSQTGHVAPSPPRFAILEEYQPGYKTSLPEPNCNIPPIRARKSQRKLDEDSSNAPVVQRLATVGSRHSSTGESVTLGRRSHKPVSNSREAKTVWKHSGGLPFAAVDDEEWLRVKRLELLGRPSWLAAPTVKPLQITFTSFEESRMIGRRRKLDENINDRHPKRRKPVGDRDDLAVGRKLPKYETSRYPEEAASDAVSVRIGTSIHGSQRTGRQPSTRGTYVSQLNSVDKQIDGNSAHEMLSGSEVSKGNGNASSTIFEPLEPSAACSSSSFEPLESSRDALGSAIEILDNVVEDTVQVPTGITQKHPGNSQYHVPTSQHRPRAEAIMSPPSPRGHARQRNGRLIFLTSPLRLQTSNSVALTTSASSIPISQSSLSAQASKDEDIIETNSNEEEWRGFVDIEFHSDDMLGIGNRSSDILEITTKATDSDPAECGEWIGLGEEQLSSPSMLDSGYSCSENTQRGSFVPAPDINSGNNYSERTIIVLPRTLTSALGSSPARTSNESFLMGACPQPVTPIRATEPSVVTGQGAVANQQGSYPQTSKQETEEDPESVWYRFVFGHDKGLDDNGEEEEQERIRRDSPLDSLAVEPSEHLSDPRAPNTTTSSPKPAVSSSPDPLCLPSNSFPGAGTQAHAPQKPKFTFRKPARFDGLEPRAHTVHIGQNVRSSNPLDLRPSDTWFESRAARRRQSQMTWLPPGFEDEEDIEDEDEECGYELGKAGYESGMKGRR
ncbi:hypothetical protein MMC26_005753 [Xylographa opegraphella]|nr:hypothetical protein [Xylographa opegraphella]